MSERDDDTAPAKVRALVPSKPIVATAYDWAGSAEPAPLFLHSSFRGGSTWLWNKLRGAPTTIAYYEIFNELLEKLTPGEARSIEASAWDSRHPSVSPYFLEFLPLLEPGGGVAGFERRFAGETYIPCGGPDGNLEASEKAYVDRLVTMGWSAKRIPVLACTRTLGRVRALKHSFGGRHILLYRNLFYQWTSYCYHADAGNTFFFDSMRRVLAAAKHDLYLRSASEWFETSDPRLQSDALFGMFMVFHLYLYAFAFDATDLLVDIGEIVGDRSARQRVEDQLSEMVRHRIDLSDVRENCEHTNLPASSRVRIGDTIDQFVKLIPAASMSTEAMLFVERAKVAALTEWDRFEFFSRRTTSVLTRQIDGVDARLRATAAENEGLKAETDRLKRDASDGRRDEQLAKEANEANIRELTAERDALCLRVAAAESARDEARVGRHDEQVAKEANEAKVRALTADRDAMSLLVATAESARDEARDAIAAERDAVLRLLSRLADTTAALDAVRSELATLQASHDGLERSLAELRAEDQSIYRRARKFLAKRV